MKKYIPICVLVVVFVALKYANTTDTDDTPIEQVVTEQTSAEPTDLVYPDLLEQPVLGCDDNIINHTGFTLSYNDKTNCPNWVAWQLTAEEVATLAAQRSNDFRGDPEVARSHRVETYDYKNSGYDRGHMCPAADMKWDATAMSDCFYMSNICPQEPTLNQRWWEHVESACRRWAEREGCVYVCCGPLYKKSVRVRYIGQQVRVRVPDGFFKVVLSLRRGAEKAIGFIYSNTEERQTMADAASAVDEVEALTGYDFFAQVPDTLESRLEQTYNLTDWD